MKTIEIEIGLHNTADGTMLNDISKILEQYMRRRKIDFSCITIKAKFHENE